MDGWMDKWMDRWMGPELYSFVLNKIKFHTIIPCSTNNPQNSEMNFL
jgi:hypothetical protein